MYMYFSITPLSVVVSGTKNFPNKRTMMVLNHLTLSQLRMHFDQAAALDEQCLLLSQYFYVYSINLLSAFSRVVSFRDLEPGIPGSIPSYSAKVTWEWPWAMHFLARF